MKRAANIIQRINALACISEQKDCLLRSYGSAESIQAATLVQSWMNEAGLYTRIDQVGNVRGKLLSSNPGAKTFIMASHIDTVANAGKFDGPLGVIMALDVIEHLILSRTSVPFHIELIAFCDEEGVRFHTTYLGSKVVAGCFEEDLWTRKDHNGISLEEVVKQFGGSKTSLSAEAINRPDCLGYFEIHIEQGPVLFESNIPVGVVVAIAGQHRAELTFEGEAGHAGTVPMELRHDALCAAAEFVLAAERFASERLIVATIGKLELKHAASNVIPSAATCSLDVRSPDANVLTKAIDELQQMAGEICTRRNIGFRWNNIQQVAPVTCDEHLNALLSQSVKEAGYRVMGLVSGAGHDAVTLSLVAPVCMLFVRCFKGISHNPLESVDIEDIQAAVEVSDNFMHLLIKSQL